jgi:hypothetical protein
MGWLSNGAGERSPRCSAAPRPSAVEERRDRHIRLASGCRAAVRSDFFVIAFPGGQHRTGLWQRGEQRLVEEFIAQTAVEAFDESVLGQLSRRDVVPIDPSSAAPPSRQPGAVVVHAHGGAATSGDDELKLALHPQARRRRIGDGCQAFAGESRRRPQGCGSGGRRRKRPTRNRGSSAGSAPAEGPSAPWCRPLVCARPAGALAAVPPGRGGGTSSGITNPSRRISTCRRP